jgi:hypothetical protein
MDADSEAGEQAKKDDDGERGDERGELPVVEGIVDLGPGGQGRPPAK